MKAMRSIALFLALCAAGSAVACSSDTSATRTATSSGGGTGTPNGSGGATGSTNASGGSGPIVNLGQGGTAGGGGQGTVIVGGNGSVAQCAGTSISAQLVPLDLYVLMDSSKSMLDQTTAGPTKWKALTDALSAFFLDPNSSAINVALKYFPDVQSTVPATCTADEQCAGDSGPCDQRKACVTKGTFTNQVTALCSTDADCAATETCVPVQRCGTGCTKVYCLSSDASVPCASDCVPFDGYCRNRDVCSPPNYAAPAVNFGTLPDAAAALTASLGARTPDGFTPTGPALTGALQAAQQRARDNPDHKVVVVLVTDGLPGGFIPNMPPAACVPGDIPGVASVLAMGTSGTPAISTFVIGVFGPCDLVDENVKPQANLDTLAVAGGTQKAVIINTDENVTQQLQDALKLVRTAAIACQYSIPKPTDGTLDFGKVNVNFTSGASGKQTIGYAGTKDKCDPALGGWYYDVDPATGGKPTQILVCDQSCAAFQAQADARVDIALGCETVPLR